MTVGGNTLRGLIREWQSTNADLGALAGVYDKLYDCQAHIITECLQPWMTHPHPLLSIEAHEANWRGNCSSPGALSLGSIIALNFNSPDMKDADAVVRTLAHELGHWAVKCDDAMEPGHSYDWMQIMVERIGLVHDINGRCIRELPLWWELRAEMDAPMTAIDVLSDR